MCRDTTLVAARQARRLARLSWTIVCAIPEIVVTCSHLPVRGFKRLRRGPTRGIPNPDPVPIPRHSCLSSLSLVSQSPECRLLNLPPEVRMLIWEFCLAQRTICITSNAGWQPKSRRKPVVSWWLSAYDDDPLNDWKPTLSEGLALLRTCRLVYREGVKILYGSNTFAFDHEMVRYHHSIGYALERMIHHGAVLPERLADIRSVRKVSDWSNSITLGWIQLFPKLRKFVMIMDRRRPPGNAYSTVKQWLQPVLDHPTILVFELGYNPYAMDSSDYDSTLDWSAEFDKRIKECMEAHGWTISTEFLKWTGRRDFFCSRKNITQGQVLSIKSSDIQK